MIIGHRRLTESVARYRSSAQLDPATAASRRAKIDALAIPQIRLHGPSNSSSPRDRPAKIFTRARLPADHD